MESEASETEVKNKGTWRADNRPLNSKNVPAEMPSAFAGFSHESEVHIVSFHGSSSISGPPFILPFFHLCLPSNLLKCSPLSLIRQTQENVPLFVSLSLSPPHSLPLSLPISD